MTEISQAQRFPAYLRRHEAGHAVIAWALNETVDGIHLRTLADVGAGRVIVDHRGREVASHGLTDLSHRVQPFLIELMRASATQPLPPIPVHDVLAQIAIYLAGPFAEARQRRVSSTFVMMTGGADDYVSAQAVAALQPIDSAAFLWRGERMSRALVNEYWPAIVAVADILREFTPGDEVHERLDEGAGTQWPMPKGRIYLPAG